MEKRFARSEQVVWNMVDEEAVLLNPETGLYYGLNRTASEVWQALVNPQTTEQLVALIASVFEAPIDVVGADVEALLADMSAKKLVVVLAE
ncbi:MAG: hypothetical protein CVV52_08695 [Spirochaetae bacterium HGW-Spirochaetae-8]|jgi:hypothetical protein|nr:MAG: hypothetical protein CVV52_08695 [Spirochaetae bacterium HGW-Spirochaetae-8]